MTISPVGYIFILLSFFLLKNKNRLYLLSFVAAVFEGTNLLFIGSYNFVLFNFIEIVILLHLIIHKSIKIRADGVYFYLNLFFLTALVIGIISPLLFYDSSIMVSYEIDCIGCLNDYAFDYSSLSHIFYLLLHLFYLNNLPIDDSEFLLKFKKLLFILLILNLIFFLILFFIKIFLIRNDEFNFLNWYYRFPNSRLSILFSEPSFLALFIFLSYGITKDLINGWFRFIIFFTALSALFINYIFDANILSIIIFSFMIFIFTSISLRIFLFSIFFMLFFYDPFINKFMYKISDPFSSSAFRYNSFINSVNIFINSFFIGIGYGSHKTTGMLSEIISGSGIFGITSISLFFLKLKNVCKELFIIICLITFFLITKSINLGLFYLFLSYLLVNFYTYGHGNE